MFGKFNLDKLLQGKEILSSADSNMLSLVCDSIAEAYTKGGLYVSRWKALFRSLRDLFDEFGDVEEVRCKVARVLLAPCISNEAVTKLKQMCIDLEALDGALVSTTTLSKALGKNIDVKYSTIKDQWQATNGAITCFSGAVLAAAGCYFENDSMLTAGASASVQGACKTVESKVGLAELHARLQQVQENVASIQLDAVTKRVCVGKHKDDITGIALRLDQLEGDEVALRAVTNALQSILPNMFKAQAVRNACNSFDELEQSFLS